MHASEDGFWRMLDLSPSFSLGLSCFIVGLILTFIREKKEMKVREWCKGRKRGEGKRFSTSAQLAKPLSHALALPIHFNSHGWHGVLCSRPSSPSFEQRRQSEEELQIQGRSQAIEKRGEDG